MELGDEARDDSEDVIVDFKPVRIGVETVVTGAEADEPASPGKSFIRRRCLRPGERLLSLRSGKANLGVRAAGSE